MTLSEALEKIWPAAAGGLVVFLAGWGIGRFNNALSFTPSTRRQHVTGSSEDDLVLQLVLKKAPPTRVRLLECEVTVTSWSHRTTRASRDEDSNDSAEDLGASLSSSLTSAMRTVGGRGMILVASDEVRFEGHCRVPRGAVLTFKIVLHGEQLIFEGFFRATPTWTASVVSLPVDSKEKEKAEEREKTPPPS